jgi:hypothetical protein
MAMNKVFL